MAKIIFLTKIRFITGLADTQIDLIRDRPAWFPPGKALQLPLPLLELRHRIVHRHLPSLAELKRAAQDSLTWLWEWYWNQLDYAFGIARPSDNEAPEAEGPDSPYEKIQALLKTYLKDRKTEIKARRKDSKAVQSTLSTYTLRYAHPSSSIPPSRAQKILLNLLITEKMILPTDKKLGSPMSGAFLIWTPLLLAFTTPTTPTSPASSSSTPPIIPLPTLLSALSSTLQTPISPAVQEAISEWITHILCSNDWTSSSPESQQQQQQREKLLQDTLTNCFSNPTQAHLALAERILDQAPKIAYVQEWKRVLAAAREGGDVDVDVLEDGEEEEEKEKVVVQKSSGPRKFVGLWRARPIGWREEGWESDD